MSDPKKHHFLPQFYLNGFRITPQTSKYAQIQITPKTPTPEPFLSAIKDTGCEFNYHTVAPDPAFKDRKSLETSFAEIEGRQAEVIKSVLSNRKISFEEKQVLAFFVSIMRVRVPSYKRYIEQFLQENVQSMTQMELRKGRLPKPPKVIEDLIKEQGGDIFKVLEVKISNWMILYQMFNTVVGSNISSIIEKMNFSLVEAPNDNQFITCDSPVTLYVPDYQVRKPYGIGLLDREVEVCIPLNKQYLLLVSWQQLPLHQIASRNNVAEFNRRTIIMADKFIYSSSVFDGLLEQISKLHSKTAGFQLSTLDYGNGFCHITRFIPVSNR
ncbi:MAG: DUF4238 domain-containing protein [Planctomycetota bacterium]|jgi:hypothetical protein